MTPALQKMVEAMIAEFERQTVDEDGDRLAGMYVGSPHVLRSMHIGGTSWNLEKVARAGLEAIKDVEVPDWIEQGNAWAAPGRMIDEILKEMP